MTNNESTIEVLNGLIQINNDRIVGYDNEIKIWMVVTMA